MGRIVTLRVLPGREPFAENEEVEIHVELGIESDNPGNPDIVKLEVYVDGEYLKTLDIVLEPTVAPVKAKDFVLLLGRLPVGRHTVTVKARYGGDVESAEVEVSVEQSFRPPNITMVVATPKEVRVRYGEMARLTVSVALDAYVDPVMVGDKVRVRLKGGYTSWEGYYTVRESDVGRKSLTFDVAFYPRASDTVTVYAAYTWIGPGCGVWVRGNDVKVIVEGAPEPAPPTRPPVRLVSAELVVHGDGTRLELERVPEFLLLDVRARTDRPADMEYRVTVKAYCNGRLVFTKDYKWPAYKSEAWFPVLIQPVPPEHTLHIHCVIDGELGSITTNEVVVTIEQVEQPEKPAPGGEATQTPPAEEKPLWQRLLTATLPMTALTFLVVSVLKRRRTR